MLHDGGPASGRQPQRISFLLLLPLLPKQQQ
jgi:hypothetical protein